MTSWVPLGWISRNVDDIIALELYTNKMHILIISLQVILDNKDWTEVYRLVTTEKKSSADPTIILYQMVKTIFKTLFYQWYWFFFFDSFSWASVNSSDRYYRKTDQWSHWAVDREVKVETRLMLNNFFHSVKCPVKMRISLLQNKLFCLQGNWRNLMTWQENPVLQCHSKSTRNLINLKEGDIKHQITQKKFLVLDPMLSPLRLLEALWWVGSKFNVIITPSIGD